MSDGGLPGFGGSQGPGAIIRISASAVEASRNSPALCCTVPCTAPAAVKSALGRPKRGMGDPMERMPEKRGERG